MAAAHIPVVPRVATNEGIFSHSVTTPFNAPMAHPMSTAMIAAMNGDVPSWDSMAITVLLKTKLLPIERSNSPEIISTPTPMAGIARSGID